MEDPSASAGGGLTGRASVRNLRIAKHTDACSDK